MVTFSSILAIGTLIASALATPVPSSELARRSLPVGITVATARTYLTQCACIQTSFPKHGVSAFVLCSDGRDAIQLPTIQQEGIPHLDHQ